MKSKNLKSLLAVIFIMSIFSSCVNNDYEEIDTDCISATPTKTIAEIYAIATEKPKLYEKDDVIEAYVTSTDVGGNVYKTLSLVAIDGTLAFSIPIDMYNIYTEYEPGRKVYVYLKGKYFNITYGSLIIGDLYLNDGVETIGRIQPVAMRDMVKLSCESISEEELVQHFTIPEALKSNNINKLIEIDEVQFADEAISTTYFNPNNAFGGGTNINLVDKNGKKINFRTSEFADFAGALVPSGRGSMRGVLTKYTTTYQFLARTESDIKLVGFRLYPLFEETFTNNFPLWSKISVLGAQVWAVDTQFGHPGSCAKISGFGAGNNANEDWLISPAINLSETKTAYLTFDTAVKYAGNTLEIFISTDYSGAGNPSVATWKTIKAKLSPKTGSYVWRNSGKINISKYTGGKVYVAFKYTSTTEAAATWEVDNVKVTTN